MASGSIICKRGFLFEIKRPNIATRKICLEIMKKGLLKLLALIGIPQTTSRKLEFVTKFLATPATFG